MLMLPSSFNLTASRSNVSLADRKPICAMTAAQTGGDDLAAQVAALAGDDPLQPIVGLDTVGIVDGDEFLARNTIGKARDVNDPLVGVEEVRLAARRSLRLQDERRQRAMRGGETRSQTGRSRANDHDVPVREM